MGLVVWAGKRLGVEEELELRRTVALLRRLDDEETADVLDRFLPENDHRWTPNELEAGAHLGPWMLFGAQVSPDGNGPSPPPMHNGSEG